MSDRPMTHQSYLEFLNEKKMMGAKCKKCGAISFPPRPVCQSCHSLDAEWMEMSGRGKLAAYTAVSVCLSAMLEEGFGRNNPNCFGVVELEEGPNVGARILGVDTMKPEEIKIGTPLKLEFVEREQEEGRQTYLGFTPI